MDQSGRKSVEIERQRCAALTAYGILDTPREQSFDQIVSIAAELFETPIALLAFADGDRHWYKATLGVEIDQMAAGDTFCQHVLDLNEALIIEDALEDCRVADNPLVIEDPRVRFYAGAPLRTNDNVLIGVLCVFDVVPRHVGCGKIVALQNLANGVMAALDLRRAMRQQHVLLKERRSVEKELLESRARLVDYISTAADLFWETDENFRFQRANMPKDDSRDFAEIQSRFENQVRRFSGRDIASDPLWKQHLDYLRAHKPFRNFTFPQINEQGETEWYETSGKPFYREDGSFAGYRGTTRDITARVKAEQRVQKLAQTDFLTGLPNRYAFLKHLRETMMATPGTNSVLVLVDIDHFKKINDTLGHGVGDKLLAMVAGILRKGLGGKGYLARIGGDEFVMLVEPSMLSFNIPQLVAFILNCFSDALDIDGRRVHIGATIGVSVLADENIEPGELLKMADLALFHAKLENRGGYRLFEPKMLAELQESEALRQEIHGGLRRGEFEVFYQPIFSINRKYPVTVEALIRWRHPERGLLAPATFLDVCEQAGLMPELTRLVIRDAAIALAAWRRTSHVIERVAINLSPSIFIGSSIIDFIAEATKDAKISPDDLEIEVTETLFLSDSIEVDKTMSRLRTMGVSIALDDFGTGYSSLVHLRRVKVDRLKIDRSFVRGMLENNVDAIIVRAVVELARSLGIEVVAEGVETQAQFDALKVLGCHCAQGFLLARPMPADQVSAYLEKA